MLSTTMLLNTQRGGFRKVRKLEFLGYNFQQDLMADHLTNYQCVSDNEKESTTVQHLSQLC